MGLLDDDSDRKVRELWTELELKIGLQGIYAAPYPHVTFHAARDYPDEDVADVLRRVTGNSPPVTVRTGGLGVFTGEAPILYLPVARSEALTDLHARLYRRLVELSRDENPHYHPQRWLPHITIAMSDVDAKAAGKAVKRLAERTFDWETRIDRLALVYTQGQEQGIKVAVPLGSNADS